MALTLTPDNVVLDDLKIGNGAKQFAAMSERDNSDLFEVLIGLEEVEHGLALRFEAEAALSLPISKRRAMEACRRVGGGGERQVEQPAKAAALAACKRLKARLVVAKLDRLARNVAFVSRLMESGVEFVAADMPFANKLTIHILAAVAEHEREAISARRRPRLLPPRREA